MKTQFMFDVHLMASIRVPAETAEAARKLLLGTIDCADSNLGAWPNGDPILCEVSVLGKGGGMEPAYVVLVEEDDGILDELDAYIAATEAALAAGALPHIGIRNDADDYGLGDELADVSLLSEHEARALPGGLPPSDCPSCGGKLGAYHVFGCPRANDPIADLAEIISPNISEAKRTYRKPELRYVGKHMAWDRSPIEELKLAAMDIMMEIDSEIEQRQNSGNDEEWGDLKRKNERLEKALAAL